MKKLPCGFSNFARLIGEQYYYVDKTPFIELLENEPNSYQFFIRPRKFGKSLFFSMLYNYYSINAKDGVQDLFGELYIGKNPTPKKNGFAVMQFDFSGMDTWSEEDFKKSFFFNVQQTVLSFIAEYRNLFPDADVLIKKINEEKHGIGALHIVYGAAEAANVKIFVIIDEYDHFANDLIAMGNRMGEDVYRRMVRASGMVRDFYEALKAGAKTVLERMFITGISPVMLDDLTSGFNIAVNLTLDKQYNEMMGFTGEEVEALMKETGVSPDNIHVDMDFYYNGYLFHKDGKNRLYNPSMVVYFLSQLLRNPETPDIIDDNLKIDYGRLQRLVQNERSRDTLIKIIKAGYVETNIARKFSIDRMHDDEYFVSLLFYLGLLTIKEETLMQLRLGIPNFSIRTVFWEYLDRLTRDSSPDMTINIRQLNEAIIAMAMEGNLQGFIAYVSEHAFGKLSNRDLIHFDEKYIQILLLAYLFQSRLYVPMSEYEADGYADIFLQRNPDVPQIKYEWVLELKYCKENEADSLPQKRDRALTQLQKYIASHRLTGREGLKAAVIVFIGKNRFEITELE
jgi:hypothetical protein